jgi:hypothetical protein
MSIKIYFFSILFFYSFFSAQAQEFKIGSSLYNLRKSNSNSDKSNFDGDRLNIGYFVEFSQNKRVHRIEYSVNNYKSYRSTKLSESYSINYSKRKGYSLSYYLSNKVFKKKGFAISLGGFCRFMYQSPYTQWYYNSKEKIDYSIKNPGSFTKNPDWKHYFIGFRIGFDFVLYKNLAVEINFDSYLHHLRTNGFRDHYIITYDKNNNKIKEDIYTDSVHTNSWYSRFFVPTISLSYKVFSNKKNKLCGS